MFGDVVDVAVESHRVGHAQPVCVVDDYSSPPSVADDVEVQVRYLGNRSSATAANASSILCGTSRDSTSARGAAARRPDSVAPAFCRDSCAPRRFARDRRRGRPGREPTAARPSRTDCGGAPSATTAIRQTSRADQARPATGHRSRGSDALAPPLACRRSAGPETGCRSGCRPPHPAGRPQRSDPAGSRHRQHRPYIDRVAPARANDPDTVDDSRRGAPR